MRLLILLLAGLFVAAPVVVAPAFGQHEGHHGMHHPMPDSGAAWRMPPMDMSMPMMPGLDGQVPVVAPYLPGAGMMAHTLPEARPREVVELADGDTLHLHASFVRRTIDGQDFVMYGYNGQYPGPLIRTDKGSTIVVEFHNAIEQPTTVHWHGVRLDNRFDGIPNVTQAPVRTGESFTYEVFFRDSGIYWYHPHVREDIQQDMGLVGNMLIDPSEDEYRNPVNREEVLILDDLLVDAHGILPYGATAGVHSLMGRFGNVMLVNGAPDYDLTVPQGSVVRFYLTNVANSRTFNVVFGGNPIKVVGSDVSFYERDARVGSVPIAPAERYIVEVRFDRPGTFPMTNSIQAINHFRGEFYPHVDTLGTITVESTPVARDHTGAFDGLTEYTYVQEDIDAVRHAFDRPVDFRIGLDVAVEDLPLAIVRAMEIDTLYVPPIEWNDAMPMMNWLSSAEQVTWILRDLDSGRENGEIHWRFNKGDLVKMRIFNDPRSFHPMNHPIHVHGQRFLVLEMDGVENENLVWKDTAIVPVGSTMDILVEMSNPGDWMMHCHIAEHLDAGMMLMFSVSDAEAPPN